MEAMEHRRIKLLGVLMEIFVKNYEYPQTGQMFKSVGWTDTYKEEKYGDAILDSELYENWNIDTVISHIRVLEEQRNEVFKLLKESR